MFLASVDRRWSSASGFAYEGAEAEQAFWAFTGLAGGVDALVDHLFERVIKGGAFGIGDIVAIIGE
jgi:hypothetical protein